MSCLSRLLGLICAVLPGLLFLSFSVRFFQMWPELGFITGPLYSLASLVTGALCLYLGVSLVFARDKSADDDSASAPISETIATQAAPEPRPAPMPEPLQATPLPVPLQKAPSETAAPTSSVFAASPGEADSAPLDTPEQRIRRLAATRPQWQATAPQLAQLGNLSLSVADATAREMVSRGDAQLQTGPNGETIYLFDLAS